MSQLTRRHILRGVGAAAAVAWPLIPKFAHAAAEFTYKYANNLPPVHPMNVARQGGRRCASAKRPRAGSTSRSSRAASSAPTPTC